MREWPGGPDAEKGKRGEEGENGKTCESGKPSLQQGLLEIKWEREVAKEGVSTVCTVGTFVEVNHFALAQPSPSRRGGTGAIDGGGGLEQLQPKPGERSQGSFTSRPPSQPTGSRIGQWSSPGQG